MQASPGTSPARIPDELALEARSMLRLDCAVQQYEWGTWCDGGMKSLSGRVGSVSLGWVRWAVSRRCMYVYGGWGRATGKAWV